MAISSRSARLSFPLPFSPAVSLMVRASLAARQRPALRRRIFPVFVIQLSSRVPDALGQTVGRLTPAFRPHRIHQCRRVWSAPPADVRLFMTILHYFAIKRPARSTSDERITFYPPRILEQNFLHFKKYERAESCSLFNWPFRDRSSRSNYNFSYL